MNPTPTQTDRRKAVWGPKRTLLAALAVLAMASNAAAAGPHRKPAHKGVPGTPGSQVKNYKLDDEVTRRSNSADDKKTSSVIVTLMPGAQLPPQFKRFARNTSLDFINGVVLDVPHGVLKQLAAHPDVFRVHDNRPIKAHNYTTSITVGARTVQNFLGYNGAGVGIAIIDSGVFPTHDDLTKSGSRVVKFVDFVNGRTTAYDDNGHGSHVAGTIAGNGYDSMGDKAGIAPGASLVSLKVLDANGSGSISNVLAALNWIVANYKTYNIRVVNMSVGAQIRESYWTDPLTLAVKRVTDLGITFVSAAGNFGKDSLGNLQLGGITAPANAPWVLTVGASSTNGSLTRNDDTMAGFSSSGPTAIDFGSKPDLVAPGVGTVSLAVPGSTFYLSKAPYLVGPKGVIKLSTMPYLSLSGTSMAAPVVSGSVALMLQANPNLTPNLIKAILQYTAQEYPGYSVLRQGAGFLNTLGAVRLAKFYADNKAGSLMPTQKVWSQQVIWGNHRISGGYLNPKANAWANNIVWGTAKTLGTDGDNIVWGTMCRDCDNIVWGTADANAQNIVWGTSLASNIVWGTSYDGDNIVWGTSYDGDNVVWGTDCGGADCDNVVWGTSDGDNIVWGTAIDGDNIVWGTSLASNIVWGTSDDDVAEAVVYADTSDEPLPSVDLEFGDSVPLITPPTTTIDSTVGGL